ncbi:hypothetical protein CY34DRAFT_339032 [Suillus luteus UH-Slu-Lm8-n1]|uniref:Uncharacterized protein n=1 Tax=Suillus luteus UH-Slu-Lm8-n1 TaxID=930992 RepID=A0A0D0AYI0_9AGAM|nr:hypothetical protein CY34DRAFT_339032 [Suillus luteus UH-Slu-Lm8-n1]
MTARVREFPMRSFYNGVSCKGTVVDKARKRPLSLIWQRSKRMRGVMTSRDLQALIARREALSTMSGLRTWHCNHADRIIKHPRGRQAQPSRVDFDLCGVDSDSVLSRTLQLSSHTANLPRWFCKFDTASSQKM